MLVSPIQATAAQTLLIWQTKWPRITQGFGLNPQMYEKYGMVGHSGMDFGSNGDDNIFAPMSGRVTVKKSKTGYGNHVRIKDSTKEVVLGHLSTILVKDGEYVSAGDKVGVMGNTGDSTGKHLHYGLRFLAKDGSVLNYDNGYFGYVDPAPFTLRWKGSMAENTLT